ncbi:MAG: Crp/Fnr family transcriptional regulator [Bacteroidota bacterium]
MNPQFLLSNIAKHIELSAEEEKLFISLLDDLKIKRKQFFLREQETANQVAFVVKGCLRAYTIDENGFEHILQFAPPDWWITDMYSFISQKPGNLFIDALEDSDVYLMSRTDQLSLFNDVPKFERYFRILTEKSLVSSRQRLIDSLSYTAQQRYETFCNYYPTLINTLPQKMIASYIGVTPEFLSKMKAAQLREHKK